MRSDPCTAPLRTRSISKAGRPLIWRCGWPARPAGGRSGPNSQELCDCSFAPSEQPLDHSSGGKGSFPASTGLSRALSPFARLAFFIFCEGPHRAASAPAGCSSQSALMKTSNSRIRSPASAYTQCSQLLLPVPSWCQLLVLLLVAAAARQAHGCEKGLRSE